MTDQEKQAAKEQKWAEKLAEKETHQLARYEAIGKADLAREKKIEKNTKEQDDKRTEKLANEKTKQSARYEAIIKADLAKEQKLKKTQGR